MIEKLPQSENESYGYKFVGKLTHEDYEKFIPEIEEGIEKYGKVSILIILEDFHGWELQAAWDDFVFDMKHYTDVKKVALVSNDDWGEWLTKLSKPFTAAVVQHFKPNAIDSAWNWLKE